MSQSVGDGDGVPDAWEQYYYGTLTNGAASDTDGDGFSLLAEFTARTHPLYGNSHQEGGVSWTDSGLVVVNLQPFERLSKIQVDGIPTNFFSPDPDVGTGIQAGTWSATAVTDWDGDGLGDLVVGGNTGTLRLIASAGPFASDGTGLEFPTSSTRSLPALGDMDGDGDTDLIVLLDDSTARFYANSRLSIPYVAPGINNFLGVAVPAGTSIATGDVNQDSLLDVLVADADGRIWEFFRNPNGTFMLTPTPAPCGLVIVR